MTKKKVCYSIDERIDGQIVSIAAKKGISVSSAAEEVFVRGLRNNENLTAAERYHYQREFIMKSIDTHLRLFGVKDMEGGCTEKFAALLYMCWGKSKHKSGEFRKGIIEISLFELLNEIKDWDKNIHDKIVALMGSIGRMKERYFKMYGK